MAEAEESDPWAELDEEQVMETLSELDDALSANITDDLSAAFAQESYTWNIPTGTFDDDGRPVALRVKVRDPKQADLPIRYMQAKTRPGGEEKSTLALFKACVISPPGLKNPANYEKLTSAFKGTLTYRLLGLIGVNGDFFTALQTMGSRTERPRPVKSTTPSQPTTASDQATSTSGTSPNSGTPTTSPEVTDSVSEENSSKTSPTLSPKPSVGDETSSTPSNQTLQLGKTPT